MVSWLSYPYNRNPYTWKGSPSYSNDRLWNQYGRRRQQNRLFHILLACKGWRWGLSMAFKDDGNSHRSREARLHCSEAFPNPYLDQPITNGRCQSVWVHVPCSPLTESIQMRYSWSEMASQLKAMYHIPLTILKPPGPRLNVRTVFPRYGDSHVKDKTVARPSYL